MKMVPLVLMGGIGLAVAGCAGMNVHMDPVSKADVRVTDATPRVFVYGKRPHYVYFSSEENKQLFAAKPTAYLGFGY